MPEDLLQWTARPDLSCEHASGAWLAFTGCSPEQAAGAGWARCVHPEDLARWLDTCVRAFDAREPFEIEYRLRHHDGAYRWVRDCAAPRFADDGAFIGFTGIVTEMTDRRRAPPRDASSPLLAGVRVLVVEDDAEAREELLKVLRVTGAETRAVANPAEAREALRRWHPDVMLSDLDLRSEEGYVRAATSRGDARLAKPVEPVALLATLARLVQPERA